MVSGLMLGVREWYSGGGIGEEGVNGVNPRFIKRVVLGFLGGLGKRLGPENKKWGGLG